MGYTTSHTSTSLISIPYLSNSTPYLTPSLLSSILSCSSLSATDKHISIQFVSVIAYFNFFLKQSQHRYNRYVNLAFSFLLRTVGLGGDRHKIIQILEDSKIIITNHKYSVGRFCKSYRINPDLIRNETFEWMKDIKMPIRADKVKRFNAFLQKTGPMEKVRDICENNKDFDKLPPNLRVIAEHYAKNLDKLRLNEEKARKIIASEKNLHKKFNLQDSLDDYLGKRWRINFDARTGRAYNWLSSTSKRLRELLTHEDGSKLVQIDAHQCQPTLLATFYNKSITEHLEERNKYLEFLSANDIYEYFVRPYKQKASRKTIKKALLTPIFGWSALEEVPIFKDFEREFPILAYIISSKKDVHHRNVALALQKAEADIFIQGVFQRLCEKKIWCLSVHDAVVVRKADEFEAQMRIMDFFEKATGGYIPLLKTEPIEHVAD